MTPVPGAESTLTDRYQTTVPEPIRKFLGLNKRDRISYAIEADGRVVIARVDPDESDPILTKFLNFLERDISQNPQQIRAVSANLVECVQALVTDVEIALDAPLSEEDE